MLCYTSTSNLFFHTYICFLFPDECQRLAANMCMSVKKEWCQLGGELPLHFSLSLTSSLSHHFSPLRSGFGCHPWSQLMSDCGRSSSDASGSIWMPGTTLWTVVLISNVVSMRLEFFIFPGCLFSLAHLELFGIYFSIPWGKQDSLQLLLSTCMEDICSSNRENSFLPLYVDIFLGGDCTLKLAVTLKLLHTRWTYAGTMSANGRAFAELVANFFTVYFLPKIT